MPKKRGPLPITPMPDVPAIPPPTSDLKRLFHPMEIEARITGGPAILLTMSQAFLADLEEEARRHHLAMLYFIPDALQLIVTKGLEALLAAPDRARDAEDAEGEGRLTPTITAEELQRRGIVAARPRAGAGAVHVLVEGEPRYAILTEERYAALVEEADGAYVARVLAAEAEIAAGKGHRYATVAEHMAAIDAAEDEDEDKPR